MTKKSDTVADVREWAERLRDSLPTSVDVAALGVKSKAPFQLLCIREALIWRTEELTRNACDALERDDFAAAAILTRSVTENAALVWRMMEVLEDRSKYNAQQLNDLLMRMLAGSGKWPEAPKLVHVLDLLRRMEKKVPGVFGSYESLSDIMHPNWLGVLGLYSRTDELNFITYFGRGLRSADSSRAMITSAILGSLGAFEYAYNRITELMPDLLGELEGIWSENF